MNAQIIKTVLFRLGRVLTFRKGVYCSYGRDNHFSKGCILYENTSIGNGNYFAPFVLSNNTRIGNFCSFGPSCKLGLADHDLQAVSTSPRINDGVNEMVLFDKARPTIIDHDVWVGANVVIRQGVHIGIGAVIGANSVVLHDVPPYSIVVGVPARIKNNRFDAETITKLIESEWFLASTIKEAKNRILKNDLRINNSKQE